jgi:hypothetical protein
MGAQLIIFIFFFKLSISRNLNIHLLNCTFALITLSSSELKYENRRPEGIRPRFQTQKFQV